MVAFGLVTVLGSNAHAVPTACVPPATAQLAWEGKVPAAQCLIGEGEKLCKAWLKTCKAAVRKAAACRNGELSASEKLEKARCKLDTIVDEKQCKKDASAHRKMLKAAVKTEKEDAFLACEDHVPNCTATCEN